MVAIHDNRYFDRLVRASRLSYERQRKARELHRQIIRHLMGEFYPLTNGLNGIATSLPLLSLAGRSMIRNTMSKAPRVMLHTDDPSAKSWIEDTALAVNLRIKQRELDETFYEVSRQSMCSVGILFQNIEWVGDRDGMRLDIVARAIDRADYVYDISCTQRLELSDYQGFKSDYHLADVYENPYFNDKKYDVQPSPGHRDASAVTNFNTQGDNEPTSLYDKASIWCMYDRLRGTFTYYPDSQPDLMIGEVPYDGPEHGPFRYLMYEKPPNHAMPISPLMHLLRKHRAFNIIDGKAIAQQEIAKWLLMYTSASKEVADRIAKSSENSTVLQDNGSVRGIHIGGASPAMVSMADKQLSDFSYGAGGMNQYSGLSGVGVETATESSLQSKSASQFLEDMQGWSEKFVQGACEDMVYYTLGDPSREQKMLWKTERMTGEKYEVSWDYDKRLAVRQKQYTVEVEPYSYRSRSPEARLNDIMSAVQFYLSVQQVAASQGVALDVSALFDQIATKRSIPELNDILIRDQNPLELSEMLGGSQPNRNEDMGRPRSYNRHSTSDGAGERQAQMQAMGKSMESQEIIAA